MVGMRFNCFLDRPSLHLDSQSSSSDPSLQLTSPSHTWLYGTHPEPSVHRLEPGSHFNRLLPPKETALDQVRRKGNCIITTLMKRKNVCMPILCTPGSPCKDPDNNTTKRNIHPPMATDKITRSRRCWSAAFYKGTR